MMSQTPKTTSTSSQILTPVDLEAWQLKRQLPNTDPNTDHFGINIGCAKCGALILRDEEIVMIRHGSLWTSEHPEFLSVLFNDEKVDEKRKCRYCDVRCEVCQQLVGMYFLEKPHDLEGTKESKLSFPCAKVLYLRQSADGTIFNKTVLLGEKALVDLSIDRLVASKSTNTTSNSWFSP